MHHSTTITFTDQGNTSASLSDRNQGNTGASLSDRNHQCIVQIDMLASREPIGSLPGILQSSQP